MNQNQVLWTETTKKIFFGVLLYSIAGILHSIVAPVSSLIGSMSDMASFASGGKESVGDGLQIFVYLLLAGIVGGYILYFIGLTAFAKILDKDDGKAVLNVRLGAILMMIAAVVSELASSIAGGIIYLIGFIIMMLGFSKLKKSSSFPTKATKGASKLFVAMVLAIIGAIVGLIPLVGAVIEGILDIISFILILSGWATIKNAGQRLNA
ncbi:MAG: hypothetical protein LBC98_03085 [Prevotellaceae bacterium]|jgi:hypothetical protein|nr:hypothetical protein [Prevotellaceae bacterium]